jgi:hypothetical protein
LPLSAVVGIEIVVVERSAAEIYVAVTGHARARAGGDIEHAAEAIAVFGCEASGHEIDCLENLRTDARRELWLRVVEK